MSKYLPRRSHDRAYFLTRGRPFLEADSLVSFLCSPFVKIQVKPSNREYTVSKILLCEQSPYFATMFKDDFKKGKEHTAILEVIEGVVSTRSVEALLQYLYTGRFRLEPMTPEDQTPAMLEVARLADMCDIEALEHVIAEHVSTTLRNLPPTRKRRIGVEGCFTPEHARSAMLLSPENEVRRVFDLIATQLRGQGYCI